MEDVAKRAAYRKAHGLDKDEGFGGWTAKTDREVLGPGIKLGHEKEAEIAETAEGGVEGNGKEGEKKVVYEKQFSGKKWLGIW